MLQLMTVVTFAIVLSMVFGAYWVLVLGPEDQGTQQLRRRLRIARPAAAVKADVVRTEQPISSVKPFARLLTMFRRSTGTLQRDIERAGLTISVGRLVLTAGFIGMLVFAIVSFVTNMILVSAALAAGAAVLPFIVVRRKAVRRLRQFEEQFPEAIDLISRALRAGHAMTTGLSMGADEMPPPVGTEFRLVYDRQNFGMSLPECLRALAERNPLVDVRFFVTAVLTQRESGGNLAEILDNLAAIIRERFVIKRHVRVVSAHGRITGWVLGALPLVLAGLLVLIAPAHMSVMITDPLGRQMVVAAVVLQIVGVLIIRRILDVEV